VRLFRLLFNILADSSVTPRTAFASAFVREMLKLPPSTLNLIRWCIPRQLVRRAQATPIFTQVAFRYLFILQLWRTGPPGCLALPRWAIWFERPYAALVCRLWSPPL